MLSSLLMLILFIVAVKSSFPYPPSNEINHHSRMDNMVEPELTNRRAFQSNDVVDCDMELILNLVSLDEIQAMIESLAARKRVTPFMVLKKLNRRMRNKEELEETLINAIDAPPLPEFLSHPVIDLPPAIKMLPETSGAPYFLPPNIPNNDENDEDTNVVIVPVAPSSMNRMPMGSRPEHKPRKETLINRSHMGPLVGRMSNMVPGVYLSSKSNQLRPPFGAIVRVNSGDPLSPINRDIIVTISPLMTLIEALRQAEIKYQSVLGVSHDTDIITFTHSAAINCYVVNNINDVVKKDDSGWKITVIDRDGQMVYDSFCLPAGKDALVKPGTVISLTYVPL